ncbi:uncharacterized protein LOC113851038 [Abrus precatorius]|uniref:Uncharacterized protein LOC113851038 n=1 Tax=Abrus precatorius TaxID=3816 RepID=A0A8B8K1M3_ABRPR|nr:uncharacterized protein LOC113851038 [Abrus precatorius]
MERGSLPSSAVIENGEQPREGPFTKYENYQRDWMEQKRGSLMLVATVIATMTFQIAINPPGGVWQQDTNSQNGCASGKLCKAGTSVLAFGDTNQKLKYEIFMLLCTISFSASQAIILLLIFGFTLSNRLVMWLLIIAMCISVYCTAGAYVISIMMVMDPLDKTAYHITVYYALYWAASVVLLCLFLLGRFLSWLLKKFIASARG